MESRRVDKINLHKYCSGQHLPSVGLIFEARVRFDGSYPVVVVVYRRMLSIVVVVYRRMLCIVPNKHMTVNKDKDVHY